RRFHSEPLSTGPCQRVQRTASTSQRTGTRLVGWRSTGERDRARADRHGAARPLSVRVFSSERCRSGADEKTNLGFKFSIRKLCCGWKRSAGRDGGFAVK